MRALPLLLTVALLAGCLAPAAERPTAVGRTPTAAPPTAAPPSAAAPSPSAAPPPPTAAPPTAAPPTAAPAAPAIPDPISVPTGLEGVGAEILFLRGGDLLASAAQAGTEPPAFTSERLVAEGVRDFAATPDGRRLALVRGAGAAGEIWLVERDGGGLRRLTQNSLAEDTPRWAPDGQTLVFTVAPEPLARPADWERWGRWCAAAEVRALDLPTGREYSLGPGCDPAVAPDGLRVAFATPPQIQPEYLGFPGATNTIRLVNRQGEHGWDLAGADQSADNQGLLVYGPAWSPDSAQVAYQRFLGYQALVDIDLTEIADSLQGQGAPIGTGAGWLMPPAFAPDGRTVAVIDHNFSDARGFSGYDIWHATLLRLGVPGSILLPSAEYQTDASPIGTLQLVTALAWSPAGDQLAVQLPAAGFPFGDEPSQTPRVPEIGPGEIWLWQPGAAPATRVAAAADFHTPLVWLPVPTRLWAGGDLTLTTPGDWATIKPADPSGIGAVDPTGSRLLVVRQARAPATLEQLFPDLLQAGSDQSAPYALPDGSSLISYRGRNPQGDAVAGVARLVPDQQGAVRATLYRTPAAGWPLERALALALVGG